MVYALWETVWHFLKKLNIESPPDPAIPLSGIYLRELKTYVHTKTCTQMFTATLFTVAQNWKQSKCPSTDECITKCGLSIQWSVIQSQKGMKYR